MDFFECLIEVVNAAGVIAVGEDEQSLSAGESAQLEMSGGVNRVPQRRATAKVTAAERGARHAQWFTAAGDKNLAGTGRPPYEFRLKRHVFVNGDDKGAVAGPKQSNEEGVNGGLVLAQERALARADIDDDADHQGQFVFEQDVANLCGTAVVEETKLVGLEIVYGDAAGIGDEDGDGDERSIGVKDLPVLGEQAGHKEESQHAEEPHSERRSSNITGFRDREYCRRREKSDMLAGSPAALLL